jgi:hypothetical protein
LVGNPEGKGLLERPGFRWEDNIKKRTLKILNMRGEGDLINLVQDGF